MDRNLERRAGLSDPGVPTPAIFKGGALVWRKAGVMSAAQFMKRGAAFPLNSAAQAFVPDGPRG